MNNSLNYDEDETSSRPVNYSMNRGTAVKNYGCRDYIGTSLKPHNSLLILRAKYNKPKEFNKLLT